MGVAVPANQVGLVRRLRHAILQQYLQFTSSTVHHIVFNTATHVERLFTLVAAAAHAAPFFRAAEAAFLVPTLLRNVVVVDEVAVIGVVEEDYSSRHSIALALGNPQGAVDVRPLIVRRVLHRSARFPAENALLRNEGGIVSNTAFCCPSLHRSQNQSPSGMPLPSDDPFP